MAADLVLRPQPLSACSTAIVACLAATSRCRIGAHWVHSARSGFQQTSLHSHWPQRLHWVKRGRISPTASASAASCSGPPIACWIS